MNSPFYLLATNLDPSTPVHDKDVPKRKLRILQILFVKNVYQQQQNVTSPERLGLLATARLFCAGFCAECCQVDKVDDFL